MDRAYANQAKEELRKRRIDYGAPPTAWLQSSERPRWRGSSLHVVGTLGPNRHPRGQAWGALVHPSAWHRLRADVGEHPHWGRECYRSDAPSERMACFTTSVLSADRHCLHVRRRRDPSALVLLVARTFVARIHCVVDCGRLVAQRASLMSAFDPFQTLAASKGPSA